MFEFISFLVRQPHKCTPSIELSIFTGLRSYEWNKFKLKSVLVNLSLCSGWSHRKIKAFDSINLVAFAGKESCRNIFSRVRSVQWLYKKSCDWVRELWSGKFHQNKNKSKLKKSHLKLSASLIYFHIYSCEGGERFLFKRIKLCKLLDLLSLNYNQVMQSVDSKQHERGQEGDSYWVSSENLI